MDRIQSPWGETHFLGLQKPDERPTGFMAYADSGLLYTRQQIQEIIADPRRTPARKMFFGPKWIKAQMNRSSCNGFAGAKALERSRVKRGEKHVELSGEGLYAQINRNMDKGSLLEDGMRKLVDFGVPPESMVPSQEYLWANITPEAKKAAARFKAQECYRVDTVDELASGLAAGFVGVVAVEANNAFYQLDSNGRVSPTDGIGNHAVGVDDVRLFGEDYEFDMFNSWGEKYGTGGRGWLSWKRHLKTTVRYHAFYLIRSTIDDPEGSNPPKLK